jgi:hypothetical protein
LATQATIRCPRGFEGEVEGEGEVELLRQRCPEMEVVQVEASVSMATMPMLWT